MEYLKEHNERLKTSQNYYKGTYFGYGHLDIPAYFHEHTIHDTRYYILNNNKNLHILNCTNPDAFQY